jgi:hypothetical protein
MKKISMEMKAFATTQVTGLLKVNSCGESTHEHSHNDPKGIYKPPVWKGAANSYNECKLFIKTCSLAQETFKHKLK